MNKKTTFIGNDNSIETIFPATSTSDSALRDVEYWTRQLIDYPSHLKRAVVEDYQQQFVSILQARIDQPEHAADLNILA